MPRVLPSLVVALLIFGTITAKAQESLLDTVLKRDKIIVATYSTSPPLAYADEKGDLVGFEIDMAHEIAKDLLGDPNKVESSWSSPMGGFPQYYTGRSISASVQPRLIRTTPRGSRSPGRISMLAPT